MNSRRGYSSDLREQQARQTRARIIDVARCCFLADGYTATPISRVATDSGVSAQTVYNVFGTKAALLKAVYDVVLAGDEEPIPFGRRPEVLAMTRMTDPRELLVAYARVGAQLMLRLAPMYARIIEGAAAGDPDLRDLVATTDAERLSGVRRLVDLVVELGGLRTDLSRDRAVDLVWTLNSYAVWDQLVNRRGWSADDAVAYVGRAMVDAVAA